MVTDAEGLGALEDFSGALLLPGDPGYEHARGVYNALVDKRPAVIARCNRVTDIVGALAFADERELEVSIRGGGHNVAGKAVSDGGVMIDLSSMRGVFVDPARRTARAQGGVTWGELVASTQLHGLAVTGGIVSTTGIAGLTLGGGLGWTMAKHGLTSDNLLSAEVITADGRVLRASAEDDADLFWGLRGGGGGLGVVSSFEYRLHAVGPVVTGGLAMHPLSAARTVLRAYREHALEFSDETAVDAALLQLPDDTKVLALMACHIGSLEQAESDLRALLELRSTVATTIRPTSYTEVNRMLDAAYPYGACNYWKSSFLRELSNDAIDVLVDQYEDCPSPQTAIVLEHLHGAATRVALDRSAYPHREPGFNFLVTSVWTDPAASDENVEWTQRVHSVLAPFLSDRRYLNFLAPDDLGDDIANAVYGPNRIRLAELTCRYDPSGRFRPAHTR